MGCSPGSCTELNCRLANVLRACRYRAQMSMFAVLAAPIFIGTDLRGIRPENLAVYLALEVLAIHQDSLGSPGHRISQDTASGSEVWVRPLRDAGTCAFLLLNRARTSQQVRLSFAAVSAINLACFSHDTESEPTVHLRDAWAQKDLGVFKDGYDAHLEGHSCTLIVALR